MSIILSYILILFSLYRLMDDEEKEREATNLHFESWGKRVCLVLEALFGLLDSVQARRLCSVLEALFRL